MTMIIKISLFYPYQLKYNKYNTKYKKYKYAIQF